MVALGAGLISLETPSLSGGNNEINCVTAALRADKASGPFGNREIRTTARSLFARIDIDAVPAVPAPGAQQQTRFSRGAERRWPRGAFVAFPPHCVPISPTTPLTATPTPARRGR